MVNLFRWTKPRFKWRGFQYFEMYLYIEAKGSSSNPPPLENLCLEFKGGKYQQNW